MAVRKDVLAWVLALFGCVVGEDITQEPIDSDVFAADDECSAGSDEGCGLRAQQLRSSRRMAGADGEYRASRSGVWYFPWKHTERSIEDVIKDAGWTAASGEFRDGNTVDAAALARWVNEDLLAGKPFNGGDAVPIPVPADGDDQVGPGQYVAYSRRQVCFIVAKSMMGAGTHDYDNGLNRFMRTCARTGGFGRSLVTLLASCAADPTLRDGKQGPMLIVARGAEPVSVQSARTRAAGTQLREANLRLCQYSDGGSPVTELPGVPEEGCKPPPGDKSGPGKDFMTGGLEKQVVVDISASWLGGYVLGHACGLGGGQDERLMVYFPEVAALTFFLSASRPYPQLRQPAWVLGARQFFMDLDGSARWNDYVLNKDVPLQSDLETVTLGDKSYMISSSRPFLAFMSENQGSIGEESYDNLKMARANRHVLQRDVHAYQAAPFQNQVRAWYNSVALTSYHEQVRPVLKQLVKSVGTGPWLAGLWWGDSQLGMLATWIGQALAAPTWGGLPVDYYMYSDFTENPGNQCYVHSHNNCKQCLRKCNDDPLPTSAYWMPSKALTNGHVCAGGGSTNDCGDKGIEHVYNHFKDLSALILWDAVENTFRFDAKTRKTVFDAMLG